MRPFDELGQEIERAWVAVDLDERALPAIAAGALARARLHERITGADVLEHVIRSLSLPPQRDPEASFGEPPVTVFQGRRFYIDVLFWQDGTTTIHRHGFQGAAQVLQGGSLHTRWRFHPEQRVSSAMLLGRAELLGSERLRPGDIFEITPELTHGLMHLERPSATVVVRTVLETDLGSQYDLRPPGVAIDPFYDDPTLKRRVQVLRLLADTDRARYRAMALHLAANADLHTVWELLLVSQHPTDDPDWLATLLEAARPRHGDRLDRLVPAVREHLRRHDITRLRKEVHEPELRTFLALLQNLPDRASILAMIAAEWPGEDPLERAWSLLLRLSGTERLGVDLSGALERTLTRAMLEGGGPERWRAELHAQFDVESVDAQWDEVLAHAEAIRGTLLAPLLEPAGGVQDPPPAPGAIMAS